MARHLWVNSSRLKRAAGSRIVDGIELSVEISPYSTPKAVVGAYDRTSGRFNIEFKYIDNEQPRAKVIDVGGVQIKEGRFSRKILGISIPIDRPPLDKVGVITVRTKIIRAFKERSRVASGSTGSDAPDFLNQEVADEILDEKAITELIGSRGSR